MTTFISVGNALQPFSRLAKIINQVELMLPRPIFIQSGNTIFNCKEATIKKKITLTEFEERVLNSNVLILHAGAGSVIHALQKNKLPIIMAREKRYGEHIDDHQVEFANALAMLDRVLMIKNKEDLEFAIHHKNKELSEIKNNERLLTLIDKIIDSRLN